MLASLRAFHWLGIFSFGPHHRPGCRVRHNSAGADVGWCFPQSVLLKRANQRRYVTDVGEIMAGGQWPRRRKTAGYAGVAVPRDFERRCDRSGRFPLLTGSSSCKGRDGYFSNVIRLALERPQHHLWCFRC